MATFQPRLEILPPAQRALWPELRSVPHHFVLYGGTAITLRLGHRLSVDFDFFTSQSFRRGALEPRIPFLKGATVTHNEENTFSARVTRDNDIVSLSFFGGLDLKRVRDPDRAPDNGIAVASLLDLAATKLKVLWQRASLKDYQDLDALLQNGVDLSTALAAARAIYGRQFDPAISLRALCYFGDGDVSHLSQAAQQRLKQYAEKVDLNRLPIVVGRDGLSQEGHSR